MNEDRITDEELRDIATVLFPHRREETAALLCVDETRGNLASRVLRYVAEVGRLRVLIAGVEPVLEFTADMAPCPVCHGEADVPIHIASPASPFDISVEERDGIEIFVAKPKAGAWIRGRHSHHRPDCAHMATLAEARAIREEGSTIHGGHDA